MKEFNAATVESVSGVSALGAILDAEHEYPGYVGLDVHKETVVACVRIADGGQVLRSVRTFATTTVSLIELSGWLEENG